MDRKRLSERSFFVFKDIVIPFIGILIAFVGLYANYSADKRQELAAQYDREQKYLEFFLQNYSDSSSTKQETAFSLLKYINKDIRKDLLYSLSTNTKLSSEAFKTLLNYHSSLNFGIANTDTIIIYYLNNKKFKDRAFTLKAQLDSSGFKGKVYPIERTQVFFDYYGWTNINTVRYDPSHDSSAMIYLYRFIKCKNADLNFISKPVPDHTMPKIIAIHLHTN